MFKSIILILIIVYCINLSSAQYQQCTTQDQRVGACIDARQCPSLVSQYALDYQCGGYGSTAVCCPFSGATNGNVNPSNNYGSLNSDRPSNNHGSYNTDRPSSNHHNHQNSHNHGSSHNNQHQNINDRPLNNQGISNNYGQSNDDRPSYNNNHHTSGSHQPATDQYRPSNNNQGLSNNNYGQSNDYRPSNNQGFSNNYGQSNGDRNPSYNNNHQSSGNHQPTTDPNQSNTHGGFLSGILGSLFNTNHNSNNKRPTNNQHQPNNYEQSTNDRPYNFRPSTINSRPHNEPSNNHQTSQTSSRFQIRDLPQPGQCGTHLADRIIGGSATQITEFPWMALLEYKTRSGKGFYCGGSLINENYVLTAAHCLAGDSGLTGVRLGEWNLKSTRDCEEDICADPVVDIPVAEQIVHEKYRGDADSHQNDIALLRLSRPARFTDWVKPICLPVTQNIRSRSYDRYPFIVAGWGKTERKQSSEVKKKVELEGVPLSQCRRVYGAINTQLSESQLCAGGVKNEDSCSGDSGGPLMALDNSSPTAYYYIAGIVSFGTDPCAQEDKPGVYTKVDQHIDWIIEHMKR